MQFELFPRHEAPFYGTYERLGVHAMATEREVLRAASRKLTKRGRRRRDHRDGRRQFYRAMLSHHRDARDLFLHVVHGSV